LEFDYNVRPDSDHVAKFQGDRSRDLGERVAKEKGTKTSAVKQALEAGGLTIILYFNDLHGILCHTNSELHLL